MSRALLAGLLALGLARTAGAEGLARKIDVDEAVKLTLESHPQLKAARLRKEALEDQSRSVRGRMLPTVVVSDEYSRYTEAYAVEFPLPTPSGKPVSFTARDAQTNTFVASLVQPVTGLLRLWQERAAVDINAEAAEEGALAGEEAVTEAVQSGYLRYFEARATQAIARASQEQLTEQRKVVEVRLHAGAATQADLLRVQVAEANARQQELQASAGADVARTTLLIAMGFTPNDGAIELVEPVALSEARLPAMSDSEVQAKAFQRRHESKRALAEYNAAVHQQRARLAALLPDIQLQAAYLNVQGQAFAQTNAAYVGVKASWPIWEWGASWYAMRSAGTQSLALAQVAEDSGRQVRTEASTRLSQLIAARETVDVAEKTISSAEEAYRVTDALVKAGSATTTDLLDAQSALTTAKLNLVRARSQRALAQVALQRATGG